MCEEFEFGEILKFRFWGIVRSIYLRQGFQKFFRSVALIASIRRSAWLAPLSLDICAFGILAGSSE